MALTATRRLRHCTLLQIHGVECVVDPASLAAQCYRVPVASCHIGRSLRLTSAAESDLQVLLSPPTNSTPAHCQLPNY